MEMMSKSEEKAEKSFDPSSTFSVVEEVRIPDIFEVTCKRPMEEHVQRLKAMAMSPDDVMLLAYVKSGTHWIWEVASMLLSGKAEHENRAKECAMMEATEIEKLESQPSPRVLNSHLPLRLLPRQIVEKKAPGGNYFTYLKDMDEFKKTNPDFPFFTMSFEDTKEDPKKAIQKLADFLGVEASAQLCQDIAEATSFTKMKEADKTKQQADIQRIEKAKMYRKGEVGDWKNHMTMAQSERLDAAMIHLKSCDYRFRFTL